jgi:hypothetical protein
LQAAGCVHNLFVAEYSGNRNYSSLAKLCIALLCQCGYTREYCERHIEKFKERQFAFLDGALGTPLLPGKNTPGFAHNPVSCKEHAGGASV